MKITDTELHSGHISRIFDAIEQGFHKRGISNSGAPPAIETDRFNRMLVTLDGYQYCISVFQPAQAPIEPVDPNLVENAAVDTGA